MKRCRGAWLLAALLTATGSAAQAQSSDHMRDVQRSALQLELRTAEQNIASAHTIWPVVTMGLGAGIGIGAGIAGMAIVGACEDDDCSVSAAVGGLVVGGVTLLTAGVIWWRIQLQRMQRLESKRYQLERDLERLELTEPMPVPKDTVGASWQLRF